MYAIMRSNKQKTLLYTLKRASIDLCMGDHSKNECINDSHRLPINHSHE